MTVLVVQVWRVRVRVNHRFVPALVGVRLLYYATMLCVHVQNADRWIVSGWDVIDRD